ncbi:MAG: methyltransferase domain-containing protein [Eubacteriales bacterium]|nr:methyltransferase domain-containing protein [Eubacteriales bacterium]
MISALKLQGDEAILDLGCGDGALTAQLAQLVPDGKVLGIDASAGMIQSALQYAGNNLAFAQKDINQMDYDTVFDVIFSNAALHWVKDHKRLIRHAFRALKPHGVLIWNFGGEGNCANFLQVVREAIREERFAQHFQAFEWPWYMPSKVEYEMLMQQVPFSSVVVTEENADQYFSDADEMIRWIDQPSLVPFIQCIPDENKEEFRDAVIQAMLERTLQPNGTCFEIFRRINVYAVK